MSLGPISRGVWKSFKICLLPSLQFISFYNKFYYGNKHAVIFSLNFICCGDYLIDFSLPSEKKHSVRGDNEAIMS